MLDGLLDRLVRWDTKKALSVNVLFSNDGSRNFQATSVQITKEKDLQIIDSRDFTEISDLSTWVNELYADLPVVLGLDGRSILVRRIDEIFGEFSVEGIIKAVVSSGNPNEFALNVYEHAGSFYAAITRIEIVQNVLQELLENDIIPAEVYIGLPAYLDLIEQFELHEKGILGPYQFIKEESKYKFSRSKEISDYAVSDIHRLNNKSLSTFGYAYRFLQSKSSNFLVANYQEFKVQLLDYPQKVLYKYLLRSTLGILLIALLVNAFLFMDYSAENDKLSEKSSDTSLMMDSYIKKQKEYDQKKQLIDQLNYNNANLAYLSDQIATCVQGNLLLTKLALNPVSSNRRKKDSPFDQGILLIEGESRNSQDFGKFITALQKLDIVETINYQNYSFNQRNRVGSFEVNLTVSKD